MSRRARIEHVLVVSRNPIDVRDAKVREITHQDFFDFSAIQPA